MARANVTGRDPYVIAKALAYAISVIDALPRERREASDRDDMAKLLTAMQGDHAMRGARAHLGFEVLFLDPEVEASSRREVIDNLARLLGVKEEGE